MVMANAPIYVLQEVGGDVRWDLPAAVTALEVTANVEVVNTTTIEQIYALSVLWANPQGEIYNWDVLEFKHGDETFNAFTLAPNTVFPFTLTLRVDQLNKYFAYLRLHCPREGTIYRDEFVDEVSVFFGELPPGWEMMEMMGPMMGLMMVGMMVPMMQNVGAAFKPEEKPPKPPVYYLPPSPPALPPGRE
jgi:hypothetical protein